MGVELQGRNSGRLDKRSNTGEPHRRDHIGFGNVLTQAWIVHDLDQRWAVALGGQLIAPTSTNGVASDAWEQVTGLVVRAMLPEISPGSYFAPQVRYGVDWAAPEAWHPGENDARRAKQLLAAMYPGSGTIPRALRFTALAPLCPSP
jgi:hypothetical protein